MLDRIQNNTTDLINQTQNLETDKVERADKVGTSNPIEEDKKSYFIDESQISSLALQKYQRELDVNYFSNILKNSSQKEADDLVLNKAFNGLLSVDNDELLAELINSKDFLDELF